MKKKHFNFAILFLLFSVCYLISLIKGYTRLYFCQGEVSKGIGVTKSIVLKFYIFGIFDVLFVDVRLVLDGCRSRGLPLEEQTNQFNFFIL